jgi:hypothetical protein
MRKSSKLLVATAAAALVATGGTAFTASNTVGGDNYAGYGTATVTGATTTGIEHTLSTDGSKIEKTLLTFSTVLTTGHQVKAGFGTTALENCVVTINATADDTALCTYAAPGYATSSADAFNVAVN